MSTFIFNNLAFSTLAGAISNTATILNLQAGGGALFPNPGANQYFTITLVDAATGQLNEIMWCTSRTGDTLTVIRAQEGTDALSWNAGDKVSNNITAGSLNSYIQSGQITDASLVHYGVASGTNTLTTTVTPTIATLSDGMLIELTPVAANTGAVALNANAIGSKPVVNRDGSALTSGTFQANQPVQLMVLGANFILMTQPANTTISQGALVHYGVAAGVNTLTSTLTPPISTIPDGMLIELNPTDSNTGAVTFNPNGLGFSPVVNRDGTGLSSGTIVAGQPLLLMALGGNFVLMTGGAVASSGPGVAVGQWLQTFVGLPIGNTPTNYLTFGVSTATGAQLLAGTIPGLTGQSGVLVWPINSAIAQGGSSYIGSYITGTPTGNWVLSAAHLSQGGVYSYNWVLTYVRIS